MTRRALATLAFGIAAGAGLVLSRPAVAQDDVKIRVAYHASLQGATTVVALEKGFFKKHGLDVEATRFASGKDQAQAILSRSVDIGAIGYIPFIVGVAKGGDYSGVGINTYYGGSQRIMVRKDSPVKTLADLRGKKVGSNIGTSTTTIFVSKVMPGAGLKEGDYALVNLATKDQVSALATGQVDAIVALDPFGAIAEQQGIARAIFSMKTIDNPPSIYAVTNEFRRKHPEHVVRFLRAIDETNRYIKENFDEAVALYQQSYTELGYKVDATPIRDSLSRLDIGLDLAPDLEAYLQEAAQELKAKGTIKTIPEWSEVIRREFLEQARRIRPAR